MLPLQSRGTEQLGEWEKLEGVVIGCSLRGGQLVCPSPVFRKQMDDFAERFRTAKNPRDPQLLSELYSAVADALSGAGAYAEAVRWRQKAADQAAKIEANKPATAD